MEKQIETIAALIEENMAMKERTAFLEGSLGGLRCALENARWHVEALKEKQKAETREPGAEKQK